MKKITSLLLFVLLLTGCYKDQGNYEYTLDSMNEILSVTFSPSVVMTAQGNTIEVQQALEADDCTRRVEAIVEQSLADNLDNLEFYWCRTYTDEKGKAVKDTLRTKGYMEFDLPVGKEMSYSIFLQIYDRSTDLSHYSSFKLNTRPVFKNSLFVLHGKEGERKVGNIEVIGNETKIYADVKTVTKDDNHYENATGLGYTTYQNIPENLVGIGVKSTLLVYADNGGTRAYNPHGMEVKFTSDQIFKPESDNFSYRRTVQTGDPSNFTQYKVVLSDNGEVYTGNAVHALYKPGQACVDNPDHQTDYEVTAATITHNRFLMWDAKHGRFLYATKEDKGFALDEASSIKSSYMSTSPLLDAHVLFDGLQKSPADMTAVIGYINYRDRDNYDQQNAYFIFKDESTGSYYRYELRMLDVGDGSKANGRRGVDGEEEVVSAFSILSEKKLTGLTPTDDATITYNSWFTTTNLFFAEGNTVCHYNVSNGDKKVVYEAPEGYDVTQIKFRTEENNPFSDDLGRYLNIVMYNEAEGNGAIAEIKFTTAADVDEDYAPLFYDKDNEGKPWGEIKDIQFVNDYMYKQIE